MSEYPKFISEKRRPAPSPKKLVESGQALWGTFDKPIENINLLDCIKPAGKLIPHKKNKFKLSVWEAFEVNLDEGILLCAVYNVAFFGFSIFIFFDKRTQKIHKWFNPASVKDSVVAPNLINSRTHLEKKKSSLVIENKFQEGKATGKGKSHNSKGDIEFEFDLTRVSPPSIVNIPFDENRPLYSEKDMFKVEGYLILNDEKITAKPHNAAIIDDHKGYYPFRAHYDWLTTMGTTIIDGEEKYFGFNLTRNQSIDQDNYNENLLWLEGKSYPLPPVYFHNGGNKKGSKWYIKDEFDMVNIVFEISDYFKIHVHLGLFDVNYNLPFGTITGYVSDHNGKKYIVDGMSALAEDKTTRM